MLYLVYLSLLVQLELYPVVVLMFDVFDCMCLISVDCVSTVVVFVFELLLLPLLLNMVF